MDEKIKDNSKVNEDHKNNTISASISLQSVGELKNEIGLIAVFKNTFKYYKIRRVTNKGAILVLLLSYLVSSMYYLFFNIKVSHLHYSTKFYSCLWLITFSVSASLSGWLADAFIGRYKVIKNSVLIMWLFVVLATVSVIIAQFADSHYHLITEVSRNILCHRIRTGKFSSHYSSIWTGPASRCLSYRNHCVHCLV